MTKRLLEDQGLLFGDNLRRHLIRSTFLIVFDEKRWESLSVWNRGCKTRENSNFFKKGKIVISVKIRNFSRSRMTKITFSLKSSREIEIPRRISLDFEMVRISRFSRRGVPNDTWQGKEMPHGTSKE